MKMTVKIEIIERIEINKIKKSKMKIKWKQNENKIKIKSE